MNWSSYFECVCPCIVPGHYCDPRLASRGLSVLQRCPRGHYCPPGTHLSTQFPCPAGTYNPTEGMDSSEACLPCPSGQYCPSMGLSEPDGERGEEERRKKREKESERETEEEKDE